MNKLRLFDVHRVPQLLLGFCASLALLSGNPGAAANVADLYQAAVAAPDESDAALTSAFQSALKLVLVRVTGRRGAAQDPAFAALINNARRYMQQYRPAPGKQIWVAFDGAAIERWLSQNGQPVWGRERPATLVLMGVATSNGGGTLLTREDTSELKRSLDLVATARGIPILWPSAAVLQSSGLTYAALAQGTNSGFADFAKRVGAEGVLLGRATDSSAGAHVRWTLIFQSRSSEFSGAGEGVNRAADSYATMFAASGESTPTQLAISNVNNLQTYAAVQSYLESLTLVSRVSVLGFDNDTLRLQVVARGGAESLQRALALNSRLESSGAADAAGALRYRAH